MNREELDKMWNTALADAIRDGEEFTRYHFAALVVAREREDIIAMLSRTEFTSLDHMPSEAALIIRLRGGP
jgi:hypothetical protein